MTGPQQPTAQPKPKAPFTSFPDLLLPLVPPPHPAGNSKYFPDEKEDYAGPVSGEGVCRVCTRLTARGKGTRV
ncbi:hypothetical protein CTA1_7160 [Colletotrichum tanaceti]|uniref:Uncharacterized protein n=1 Tax=Colletotrichum tanaceti TaxID=1306861 RepID=A0A4U6X250_9PEZI|nr:hypothetical protein CTA1_7160 [Colletotrichum tanaceti]